MFGDLSTTRRDLLATAFTDAVLTIESHTGFVVIDDLELPPAPEPSVTPSGAGSLSWFRPSGTRWCWRCTVWGRHYGRSSRCHGPCDAKSVATAVGDIVQSQRSTSKSVLSWRDSWTPAQMPGSGNGTGSRPWCRSFIIARQTVSNSGGLVPSPPDP